MEFGQLRCLQALERNVGYAHVGREELMIVSSWLVLVGDGVGSHMAIVLASISAVLSTRQAADSPIGEFFSCVLTRQVGFPYVRMHDGALLELLSPPAVGRGDMERARRLTPSRARLGARRYRESEWGIVLNAPQH
jgi:hypothetical protein